MRTIIVAYVELSNLRLKNFNFFLYILYLRKHCIFSYLLNNVFDAASKHIVKRNISIKFQNININIFVTMVFLFFIIKQGQKHP